MTRKLPRLAAAFVISLAGCAQVRHVDHIEHIHNLGHLLESNPSDKASLTELARYLTDPNPALRAQATSVAGNLGAKRSGILSNVLVPLLTEKLEDNEHLVRRYAVKGLGEYGRVAEAAVQPLIEVLRDYKTEDSSWLAADVLGDLGPVASLAVPELIKSLEEKGPEGSIHEFTMQKSAGRALSKISPLDLGATTQLRSRLRVLAGEASLYVAFAILKSQPKDPEGTRAVAAVITSQTDAASVALREIGRMPDALFDVKVLLPALERASKSNDSYIRDLSSKQFSRFTNTKAI